MPAIFLLKFSSLLSFFCKLNSNLLVLKSNINPYFLLGNSKSKTFDDIISDSKGRAIFFANWSDTTNFPIVYGCGICIPAADSRYRYIIYAGGGNVYTRYIHIDNINAHKWYMCQGIQL